MSFHYETCLNDLAVQSRMTFITDQQWPASVRFGTRYYESLSSTRKFTGAVRTDGFKVCLTRQGITPKATARVAANESGGSLVRLDVSQAGIWLIAGAFNISLISGSVAIFEFPQSLIILAGLVPVLNLLIWLQTRRLARQLLTALEERLELRRMGR